MNVFEYLPDSQFYESHFSFVTNLCCGYFQTYILFGDNRKYILDEC